MQQHHAASPVTTATVSPKRPRNFGQFWMSRLRTKIDQTLLKRVARPISRIAPQLAVSLFRLFVRRRKQCAVILLRERLPMQVVCASQTGLARPLAATVLMYDYAPQSLGRPGNPDCVIDRKGKLAGLSGSLVPHSVIRWIGWRKDVIGRLLRQHRCRQHDQNDCGYIRRGL